MHTDHIAKDPVLVHPRGKDYAVGLLLRRKYREEDGRKQVLRRRESIRHALQPGLGSVRIADAATTGTFYSERPLPTGRSLP